MNHVRIAILDMDKGRYFSCFCVGLISSYFVSDGTISLMILIMSAPGQWITQAHFAAVSMQ